MALSIVRFILISVVIPLTFLATFGSPKGQQSENINIFFGQGTSSVDDLHFYYDQSGVFTVSGWPEMYENVMRPLHATLFLRPLKCNGTAGGVDLTISFCAIKCGNNGGKNGASSTTTTVHPESEEEEEINAQIVSLLLCYKSQLGPTLDSRYRIHPPTGSPEVDALQAKCLQAVEMQQSRAKEQAEEGHIADTYQQTLDGKKRVEEEELQGSDDLGPDDAQQGSRWIQWNGLEVRMDMQTRRIELRTAMVDHVYEYSLPEDEDCFDLKIRGGTANEHVSLHVTDCESGEPLQMLKPTAFDYLGGEMPKELIGKPLEDGELLETVLGDKRGLWLIPLDFLPKGGKAYQTMQTIVKYLPESDENSGGGSNGKNCRMEAYFKGKSVFPCKVETRKFQPAGIDEDRGEWKLYRYNVTYGQLGKGREAEIATHYCDSCLQSSRNCKECDRHGNHLVQVNKAIYRTKNYVAHFHDFQFLARYFLMPQQKQEHDFTRLGRPNNNEPDGNVIEQFFAQCGGMEFALPIHN